MTTLWKSVHKLLHEERLHQRVFLVALCSMPLFWVGLRVFGLRRLLGWVQRRRLSPTQGPDWNLARLQSVGRMVNAAARFPPYPQACLARSLLLVWQLRGLGVAAQVVIGARFLESQLDAHAWVEWQGQPVNDRADIASTYTPMGELAPLTAFHAP